MLAGEPGELRRGVHRNTLQRGTDAEGADLVDRDELDNGLCETTIGLYKTECVREGSPFRTGPIGTLADLEEMTSSWVAWSTNAGSCTGSVAARPRRTKPSTTRARSPRAPTRGDVMGLQPWYRVGATIPSRR